MFREVVSLPDAVKTKDCVANIVLMGMKIARLQIRAQYGTRLIRLRSHTVIPTQTVRS